MELLAHWIEAGEWWRGEHEREFREFLDRDGVRRTDSGPISRPEGWSLTLLPAPPPGSAQTVNYALMKREYQAAKSDVEALIARAETREPLAFAPLHVLSGYSFGRSTLTPEVAAGMARLCGYPAAALTDRFSLGGAVQFVRSCSKVGVKPLLGAAVELDIGGEVLLLVESVAGYRNLSRLLTRCHREHPRLVPLCRSEWLGQYAEGLICLTGGHVGALNRLLASKRYEEADRFARFLRERFGDRMYLEIERTFLPWEISVNRRLLEMSSRLGVPAVAGGPIQHVAPEDFAAQDALLCAETLCTVEELVGRKPQRPDGAPSVPARSLNAERYFRTGDAWRALFADAPELLGRTLEVAERCAESPLPPRPGFPRFCEEPEATLREVVFRGARERYGEIPFEVKSRLNLELSTICHLGFAGHFLAFWEACNWARGEGILFSARGSAVDSAVAWCLGISRIDAARHNLHFDRFLPPDGSKRPDIDVDFEAARREDVRQFFARRYGKEHTATVGAYATWQGRGIVREIGKALMIPQPALDCLAKRLHGSVTGARLRSAFQARPELRDSGIPVERFELLFEIASTLDGLPRHLGAHSSGVVLSDVPVCDVVPVLDSAREDVPILQWDKYSAKHFFDKLDVLCLRGHDVLKGTQAHVREKAPEFTVLDLPMDDDSVWEPFRSGELIGVPQSASPAMRQAHVRLGTSNLHEASLIQAGIRPGVGGAVKLNALIRRKRGLEPCRFDHPLLETILGSTYGIVVFQEQVDQLLETFCGYTPGEAEEIRDEFQRRRADEWDEAMRAEVLSRAMEGGFSYQVANAVWELVSGFRGYGFAQGHALAFADISIRSVYCMQRYPVEYFAALLSSQPAGYYGPATIANEARNRGIPILPLSVNRSQERFTVEDGAIRLGWMQQHNLSEATRRRIFEERERGEFRSVFDFAERVRPSVDELECLVLSGAFDELHSNRRATLWCVGEAARLRRDPRNALFAELPEPPLPNVSDFSPYEKAVLERAMLGMDVAQHLMAFERERIAAKGGIPCANASRLEDGKRAVVVGIAMRLRFPPTASGRRIVFFDLEDESGLLNVTVFDETYQRDGHSIITSPFVTLRGYAQEREGHIAFVATRVYPYRMKADPEGIAEQTGAVHAEDFITRRRS